MEDWGTSTLILSAIRTVPAPGPFPGWGRDGPAHSRGWIAAKTHIPRPQSVDNAHDGCYAAVAALILGFECRAMQ